MVKLCEEGGLVHNMPVNTVMVSDCMVDMESFQ